MQEVKGTMLSMRAALKEFQKNAQNSLREIRVKQSVESQTITSLQFAKKRLVKEKDELQGKVKNLEEEVKGLKFSQEVPDTSFLENEFADSDNLFGESGIPEKTPKLN
jgi:uncharacterized protein YlxW (UPF0749 family)